MPNNEEHARRTDLLLNIPAEDLHAWIDEPSRWLVKDHRLERHNFLVKFPEWAIKKYGLGTCVRIHLVHLIDDNRFRIKTMEEAIVR